MKYLKFMVGLGLILANCASAHSLNQYYRSYWNPLYQGERLAYCSMNDKECGLPIAHRYCRMMGYERATQQTIEYNVGLTHYIGCHHQCKGWTCHGFKLIRCMAKPLHRPPNSYHYRAHIYVLPRYERYRVAWCLKKGQCGHYSANSFCRRMGFMRAMRYSKQEHVLATRQIGDQKLCFGPSCSGFSRITCYR